MKTKQETPPVTIPDSIKDFIDNHSAPFSLNNQQFKLLLEGSSDVLTISKNYSSDLSSIAKILYEFHSQFNNRWLKAKCIKLKSKLCCQLVR